MTCLHAVRRCVISDFQGKLFGQKQRPDTTHQIDDPATIMGHGMRIGPRHFLSPPSTTTHESKPIQEILLGSKFVTQKAGDGLPIVHKCCYHTTTANYR